MFKIAKQRIRQSNDVQQVRVIKSKTGEMLMEEEKVKQRWKEHFDNLLNQENPRERISNAIVFSHQLFVHIYYMLAGGSQRQFVMDKFDHSGCRKCCGHNWGITRKNKDSALKLSSILLQALAPALKFSSLQSPALAV